MKQVELTVKIEHVDNQDYPYEMNVSLEGKPECSSWYKGKTPQELIELLYKSLGDSNLRYWHMMDDK